MKRSMTATQAANDEARKRLSAVHGIEAPARVMSRRLSNISDSRLNVSPQTKVRENAWVRRQTPSLFAKIHRVDPTPPFTGVRPQSAPHVTNPPPHVPTMAPKPKPKPAPNNVITHTSTRPAVAKKARVGLSAANEKDFMSKWATAFGGPQGKKSPAKVVAKAKAKAPSPAKPKAKTPPPVKTMVSANAKAPSPAKRLSPNAALKRWRNIRFAQENAKAKARANAKALRAKEPRKRKTPPSSSGSDSNDDINASAPWWRRPLSPRTIAQMKKRPGGAEWIAKYRARKAAENAENARIAKAQAAAKSRRPSPVGRKTQFGFRVVSPNGAPSSDSDDEIPRGMIKPPSPPTRRPVQKSNRGPNSNSNSNSISGRKRAPVAPVAKKAPRTIADELRMSIDDAETAFVRRIVRSGIKKQHAAGAPKVGLTLRDVLSRLKKAVAKHPNLHVPDLDGGDKCVANKPADVIRRCIARMAVRICHSPAKDVRLVLAATFASAGIAKEAETDAICDQAWKKNMGAVPARSLSASPCTSCKMPHHPTPKKRKRSATPTSSMPNVPTRPRANPVPNAGSLVARAKNANSWAKLQAMKKRMEERYRK